MDATEPPERLGGFTRVYPPAGLSPSERRHAETLDAKLLAHALSFFRPEPGCSCGSCDARKRTSGPGGVAETSYSVQHGRRRFTDNLSVKSYADSYSRLAKKY